MTVCTASRLLHKIPGSVEVLLIARHLVQLAERHLDDGVPARTVYLSLVGTEGLAYEVGILDGDIEEGLLARSAVMGHGTLDEVAGIVELVGVDFLPLMRAPPSAQARTFISDTGGEVSIWLLCLCDDVDHGIEIMVEPCVVVYGQGVRCTFDDLVGVGIVKREITLMLTFDESGGQGEIVETAVHLTLMEGRRDEYGAVDLDTW